MGAEFGRFKGGYNALLIVGRAACRPDARGYKLQGTAKAGRQGNQIPPGTNQSPYARVPSQGGQIGYLVLRGFLNADPAQLRLIQRRQDRHPQQEQVRFEFSLGPFSHCKHFLSATGVQSQHIDGQVAKALHRFGDGMGNIVQFQVEKYPVTPVGYLPDPIRAMGGKHLQAHLDPFQFPIQALEQVTGGLPVRQIQGQDELAGLHGKGVDGVFSIEAGKRPGNVSGVNFSSTKRMFCPAKVNLFLAVTGRRADGFHELISLVAPVSLGDDLIVSVAARPGTLELVCEDDRIPLDETNLVMRAAREFLRISGHEEGLRFELVKRIPVEAGLGGGSSDAAGALLLLNDLFDHPFSMATLEEMAAELGSDCPFFLRGEPRIMRGRGENLEALSGERKRDLAGRWVALFKPMFGINTAWAYDQLAGARPSAYVDPGEAEDRLAAWNTGRSELEALLFNNLEVPVFKKYVALPTLLQQIREDLHLPCAMSGSGSTCFALLPDFNKGADLADLVKRAWGENTFLRFCQLGGGEINHRGHREHRGGKAPGGAN